VALVGCGRIAGLDDRPDPSGPVWTYAQAFHRHPRFKLEAACEPAPARLAAFCAAWGVERRFERLEQLLEAPATDLVCICSPSAEHFGQAMAVLNRNAGARALMIEKPVCSSVEELRSIGEAAARCRVPVAVNHTRRFDPVHRGVARRIAAGELGSLVRGRCEYSGGWLNNGTHLVDTLRMLLGGNPTIRAARPGAEGRAGDPCIDVELCFGGAPIRVESFDERRYEVFEIDLRFERGRIRIESFGTSVRIDRQGEDERGDRVLVPDASLTALEGPLLEAGSAIAAELDGTPGLATLGVGLSEVAETMNTVWAAREAARNTSVSR
jgi:predicted dehydrogenase